MATQFDYRGIYRSAKVPTSLVSLDDLKRLHADLRAPALDAAGILVNGFTQPENQTQEEFDKAKQDLLDLAGPVIRVFGSNGEQATGITADVFDDLPETVSSIEIDSSAALQSYNVTPLNRFKLVLDFSETPKIADYNPNDQNTPNNSLVEVIGDNKAWVVGVHESILGFFRDRKRKRRWGWLHSREFYNLIQAVFLIPASIWLAFRFDGWLVGRWEDSHIIMRSAVFLYVVLFVSWIGRGLVGAVRWAFPVIELENSRSATARITVSGITAFLVYRLGYDVMKALFFGP